MSSSSCNSQITHPAFFEKLTDACVPLSHFFQIEDIEKQKQYKAKNHWFGLDLSTPPNYSAIIVVNFSNSEEIQLEFITCNSYEATVKKHGKALCLYFGVTPLISNLNINSFRAFYKTNIGQQLVQMYLSGKRTKIKSKLSALMVPHFLQKSESLEEHNIEFLNQTCLAEKEISTSDLNLLDSKLLTLKDYLSNQTFNYPITTLNYLYNLTNKLERLRHKLIHSQAASVFLLPSVLEKLQSMNLNFLYPNNPDVYIDFICENTSDLNKNLTKIKFENSDKGKPYLAMYNESSILLKIYSDKELLKFIQFISSQSLHIPIWKILKGLKIPSQKDLSLALSSVKDSINSICNTQNVCDSIIDKIFHMSISNYEHKSK